MSAKPHSHAIEGWFDDGAEPALVGTQCEACGTFYFPRVAGRCRNPHCGGSDLNEVRLSRTGTVWSWTTHHYAPPYPYMASDPFVPYTVVAVSLEAEQMVVLGQLAAGFSADALSVGQPVELRVEPLFEDDDAIHTVWKWAPTGEGSDVA